jgi:hypothetical protein
MRLYPAWRWVVERTLAWLSKCRAILARYDKKVSNYIGLICNCIENQARFLPGYQLNPSSTESAMFDICSFGPTTR